MEWGSSFKQWGTPTVSVSICSLGKLCVVTLTKASYNCLSCAVAVGILINDLLCQCLSHWSSLESGKYNHSIIYWWVLIAFAPMKINGQNIDYMDPPYLYPETHDKKLDGERNLYKDCWMNLLECRWIKSCQLLAYLHFNPQFMYT